MTEIARDQIEILNLGRIVFRDTDSCGVLGVQPNVEQIKSDFKQLNVNINKAIKVKLGNTYNFTFAPELKNYQLKTYYPPAKKAYARLELDLTDDKSEPYLKIKGVSWSLMSEYGKTVF